MTRFAYCMSVNIVYTLLFKFFSNMLKRLMRYVTTFFSTDSLEVKSIRKSLYFYIKVFFFISLHVKHYMHTCNFRHTRNTIQGTASEYS